MKLSKIEITNFRCFEKLTVNLPTDLVVFVGNNGAGKTAILDAIGFGLSHVLTRLPRVKGKNLRREDIRITNRDILAPFVRVEMQDTNGVQWTRTLKRDPTRQTDNKVPDAIDDKALFDFLDPAIHAVEEGRQATLPVFAYYGVSRAIFEIPERRRAFRKEFRRFDALENALEPTTRFKDLFEWFYAQERSEMAKQLEWLDLPEIQEWLKNPFSQSSQLPPKLNEFVVEMASNRYPILQAVREAISAVVEGYSRPRIKENPLRMVLTQHLHDGTARELSLQMLSDGYRTMLALVMDFARRMAQANPHMSKPLAAEAILMVDEIDLHLHPVWQQTVIPSFRRAFPNTQLVVSTHSPQVLTTVESDRIFIVESGGVRRCPAPTYGANSADVVAEVLGLKSLRPPNNVITKKITDLFDAIDRSDLEESKKLRLQLKDWAKGFPEPDLVRADMLIKRLEIKANAKNAAKV